MRRSKRAFSHGSESPTGLVSKEGRVPLLGVSVRAEMVEAGIHTTVKQRYRNREDAPIETIFKFPLPPDAAICGFRAVLDGREVVGEVEEKEKAFRDYDAAMGKGDFAALLDQERPDLFTASVGNLMPDREAMVEIRYIEPIRWEDGKIRFCIPTTIAPRYVPNGTDPDDPEVNRVLPDYVLDVPYGFGLQFEARMASEIHWISSVSHKLKTQLNGTMATAHLEKDASPNRDVVIEIAVARTHEPVAFISQGKDGYNYAMLRFIPEFDGIPYEGRDIVFVLDRSGSMNGISINEARCALEECVSPTYS